MKTSTLTLLVALTVPACAPKGSRPHDMSEAGHDAAAADLEAAATTHAAAYDPAAEAALTQCRAVSSHGTTTCWTSTINPTEEHRLAADKARKAAAAHREASAALASAEQQACAGIAPDDRDISPFDHTEDIASVTAFHSARTPEKGGPSTVIEGATITFRAVPGLTEEGLQRVVDCHLARNAALGHDVAEMPNCPLVPKGVEAKVRSTGAGFAVTVSSEDTDTGKEILARAERLAAR